MTHRPIRRRSPAAALIAAALLLTACPADTGDEPAVPSPAPDATTPTPVVDDFVYETGLIEDITTDNVWARFGSERGIWNAYVLDNTICRLYVPEPPTWALLPDLAAADFEDPRREGDTWFVEVTLRDDAVWSDGEPVTAHDLAFTWETVVEFGLGQSWQAAFRHNDPVTGVGAVDEGTVRVEFDRQPGLAVWPHAVGVGGVVMPRHFWEEVVAEARAAGEAAADAVEPDEDADEDADSDGAQEELEEERRRAFRVAARQHLYGASGAGSPSCGPMVLAERQRGRSVRTVRNDTWHRRGIQLTHFEDGSVRVVDDELGLDDTFGGDGTGEVLADYTVGPHIEAQVYTVYGTPEDAIRGLQAGEISYLYNPLGLDRTLQDAVLRDPELELVVNPAYSLRYLAFNHERAPMSDPAFRRALATRIDRELVARDVLAGIPFPQFTTMPAGNLRWFEAGVAQHLTQRFVAFGTECDRIDAAVRILRDAGYAWDTEPQAECPDGPVDHLVRGSGLRLPDGTAVGELRLLAPSAGYDPLRASFAVFVERWAQELGIPVRAHLTGFDAIVETVFQVPDPPGDWDLYILGWELGNPALPTFHHDFFHSAGSSNYMGYANPAYDAAADRLLGSRDVGEMLRIMWEDLEPMIAEDLPYVNLFDTPVLDVYRHRDIRFPFTDTLGGIQFASGPKGAPHLVTLP